MSIPAGGLLVVGMHRSGTSLVSRLLGQLGVFMGADLNMHAESDAFLDLNSRIFRLGHGDWDVPEPVAKILANDRIVKDLTAIITEAEWPGIEQRYFGHRNFFSKRRSIRWPALWGWKDPRNSITLPIWRGCIPGARIVHVYRNPADVALSLATRERARYRIRLDRGTLRSLQCLDKEAGVRLWTRYVCACLSARESWPVASWLDLCYEELLVSPLESLKRLARFLGLTGDDSLLQTLAQGIDAGRAYVFRDGPSGLWGEQLIGSNPQARELGYLERLDLSSSEESAHVTGAVL